MGTESFPRLVVTAAIKWDDTTICGARHYSPAMHTQLDSFSHEKLNDYRIARAEGRVEQGFVDQWDVFMSREEAMTVVKENGQRFNIERNGDQDIELYSEGIH